MPGSVRWAKSAGFCKMRCKSEAISWSCVVLASCSGADRSSGARISQLPRARQAKCEATRSEARFAVRKAASFP